MSEGQLLADLAFADIVFWVRHTDDTYVAVGHSRPSSSATLFYRDVVGTAPRPEWGESDCQSGHQQADCRLGQT